MSAINDVLDLLKDGTWHSSREICEKCALLSRKVNLTINFLSEYDFVQIDDRGQNVKLRPAVRAFLMELQRLEGENVLSHERL